MAISRRVGVAVTGSAFLCAVTGVLTPAVANADGPILSGTYQVTMIHEGAAFPTVATITSDCAQCDATVFVEGNTNVVSWTGSGWGFTNSGGCGPMTSVYTPSNVDGVVQNFTIVGTYLTPEVCGIMGPVTGTATRIGD